MKLVLELSLSLTNCSCFWCCYYWNVRW